MWSELPTVEKCIDCRRPFSFYFELVGTYWKTESANALPLHRACTLARKQGATFISIESALSRQDVRDEIHDLDTAAGGGGSAEAVAIAYFASEKSPEIVDEVASGSLIGQLIVINYRPPKSSQFAISYIYEAVFAVPALNDGREVRRGLLNNFVNRDSEFHRTVRGRDFSVNGVYYCQQNGQTNVCAHACLRMALNTFGGSKTLLTNRAINNTLRIKPPFSGGLSLGQIATVIDSFDGVQAAFADCTKLSKPAYLSILGSIVESGDLALLVFTTANAMEHVVTVFGHTRNSDEWHPQAIPAYAGPQSAQYYASNTWIDHFLIHDDNFGPYYTLSSRALEVDPGVIAHWIIALHPIVPNTTPAYAEAVAAILLANWLPSLAPLGSGRWFEYITRNQWLYVLRTILIEKSRYVDHLRVAEAHDSTRLTVEEINLFSGLPDRFWMVEFSLPPLYTGNRSKLGEILLDATTPPDPNNPATLLLAMRMPGLILLNDGASGVIPHVIGMHAHCGIYVHRLHEHVW